MLCSKLQMKTYRGGRGTCGQIRKNWTCLNANCFCQSVRLEMWNGIWWRIIFIHLSGGRTCARVLRIISMWGVYGLWPHFSIFLGSTLQNYTILWTEPENPVCNSHLNALESYLVLGVFLLLIFSERIYMVGFHVSQDNDPEDICSVSGSERNCPACNVFSSVLGQVLVIWV